MRMVREIAYVASCGILAAVLSSALYSNWLSECCGEATNAIGLFFLPGAILGSFFADGIHSAGQGHVTFGVFIQLLIIVGICRVGATVARLAAPTIFGKQSRGA